MVRDGEWPCKVHVAPGGRKPLNRGRGVGAALRPVPWWARGARNKGMREGRNADRCAPDGRPKVSLEHARNVRSTQVFE